MQLPPRWRRNVDRLDEFLAVAPRDRCAGRSSSASRRGCTTTCTRCSSATAPRCASTTCCRPPVDAAPPTGPTSGSTVRTRVHEKYVGRYGGRGSGAAADGSAAWVDEGVDVVRVLQQRLRAAVSDAHWLQQRFGLELAPQPPEQSTMRRPSTGFRRRARGKLGRAARRVGVSSIAISLPSPWGRTWMSTTATPAGRNLTSSFMRRGGSRSRISLESLTSPAAGPHRAGGPRALASGQPAVDRPDPAGADDPARVGAWVVEDGEDRLGERAGRRHGCGSPTSPCPTRIRR